MQQERKDFKEKLLRENALASKKMTALEKNYRDQLDMLSEQQVSKRAEEKLMHTGHREIVKQIEKTLKRENESKLALLVIKYKQQ